MGVTAATSFILPSAEIPSLPLDISGPLNASSSISRIASDHINEQDGTMGWLPSTCNLQETLETQANVPAISAQSIATSGNVSENEALCMQKYVPTASPETKPESLVAEPPILGSSGAKVDVESFDADVFFDEESTHARSSNNLRFSTSFPANRSSRAVQAINDLTSGFIGSIAPTATSALDTGTLNDYSGSCGFNDLFDILQSDRHSTNDQPQVKSNEDTYFTLPSAESACTTNPSHANHADMKQAPGTSMADTGASSMDNNKRGDQDNDEGDVPLGLMLKKHGYSLDHASEKESQACSDGKDTSTKAASALVSNTDSNTAPVILTDSMVILDTSIADFAGALIDSSGLDKWDLSLGGSQLNKGHSKPTSAPSAATSGTDIATTATVTATLTVTAAPSTMPTYTSTNAESVENSVIMQADQQQQDQQQQQQQESTAKLPVAPLNSPDHHRLGRRNPDLDHSTVAMSGLGFGHQGNKNGAQPEDPGKSVGLQSELLTKYSGSLYASRAFFATVVRGNRHLGALNGHASTAQENQSKSSLLNANTVPVVQYESVKPVNTGVSKVIRGQLNKDIIEKDNDYKPELAVRRVRRIKSESKVVPLKAIRLKLNGSIASNSESICRSGIGSADGLRHAHGINGSDLDTTPLSKFVSQSQKLTASKVDINSTNPSSDRAISSKSDPFGEFSKIQERLKRAEEQKRLEQRARILDKEGVDNVRIADIIENRQDIPLAVQIEERRRMQLAKQQALLSQQLEQQRIHMETQRANAELQRQYEQFKRQSLHPSLYDSSDGYTGQWMQHQDAYAGLSPPISQFQQHLQGNRPATSQGHYNPYTTASYDQAESTGPNTMHYNHQQRPGSLAASRPSSLYTNNLQIMQGYHKSEAIGQAPARAQTMTGRRQAGAAFVKHNRSNSVAARSVHSNGSSDSWQSHVDHKSAAASIHAKTDPAYNGSIYIPSPEIATMTAKRSLSYGNADHFRGASSRPGFAGRGGRMSDSSSAIPPVPPLPQSACGGFNHYHYHHQPPHPYHSMQGPPAYAHHSGYNAWGSPPDMHGGGGMGRQHSFSSMQKSGHSAATYPRYIHGEQASADMHKFSRKRIEMSANVPSLLQRLDQARETGLLPGRHVEKLPYSQGAYQNNNANQIIREGVNPQYFGDGDTLLIDRVYESEKTRSALMKKISRTYTGIGGETGPPAMFTH
ncbi:hypothetical protein LPJ64_004721 [Coemansia asiatica]|uniref:Uncharacterized protein n=1 Tax=Coemansia asiatica TaxID=1052880 RepID=A0A9W7XIK9_9FUNG|nr:hypothetical protein LPJ64_004721 [Coemansia asiatica]